MNQKAKHCCGLYRGYVNYFVAREASVVVPGGYCNIIMCDECEVSLDITWQENQMRKHYPFQLSSLFD